MEKKNDLTELSVGVDVGGTKVAAAAVAGTTLLEMHERPTMLTSGEALVDEIELAAREVIARAGQPVAVGIGVPSQIDFATGRVITSVNIPLAGFNLREDLGTRLGLPVYVDNDANCAALAEAHHAEGGPSKLLVMYTIGTGVGGGVVIDGHVFRGATGLGAELGPRRDPGGRPGVPGQLPEPRLHGGALQRAGARARRDERRSREAGARRSGGSSPSTARSPAAPPWLPPARATPTPLELLQQLGTWLGRGHLRTP